MESLFSISEPPLGVRIMNNPTWPLLTDEARMEKLRTLLFHDLHGTEGAAESQSHQSNSSSNNINVNSSNNEITLHDNHHLGLMPQEQSEPVPQVSESEQRVNNTCATPSRYESQKRRDWNTFRLYLKNHRLELQHCSGAHVLEFLRYLDQFGKTKVHLNSCSFYGVPIPPHPCRCPLRQAWGSLDALIGRLRAAFEEHGGKPESNPFGARMVRLYLREVRETQAKARGVAYGKKKRKCSPPRPAAAAAAASAANMHGNSSANIGASSNSGENHPHQQQQLLQQQTSPEPLPPQMQQALVPHDQAYDHRQAHDPGSFEMPVDYSAPPPDPHPLNAYSPNSNPLIKPAAMSNFRPPLSFHSFLDDLPGRRAEAAGWAIGTVYGR